MDLTIALSTRGDEDLIELAGALGRSPTVADLAAHLDVTEDDVIEMLGASNAQRPLSLEVPAAGSDDDTTLLEVIGGDDAELALVEHRQSLRVLMALLPPRQQQILNLRFYGNLSQSQIAERIGLSEMHVSRLLRQSLDFLRRRLTE